MSAVFQSPLGTVGRFVSKAKKPQKQSKSSGSFRIIAGRWRGRRLQFPANAELRPTADRVRETLFNWLQPYIAGANVLDAFAGSGALSLESLSRGAAAVTAWDKDSRAVSAIRQHVDSLGLADGQQLYAQPADSLTRLQQPTTEPFDIVLLDPPFRRGWWPDIFAALAEPKNGWLADGALVYIEFEREMTPPELPAGWEVMRQQTAGQVAGQLIRSTQLQ